MIGGCGRGSVQGKFNINESELFGGRHFLLAVVDDLSEFAGRLEGRHKMFIELDRLTGAWVACGTRQPLFSAKRAKATDLDVIAVGERIRDRFEKSIDEDLGFEFGNAGRGRDAVYDVGFRHTNEVK